MIFGNDGTIERKTSVYIEVDDRSTSGYLKMNIKSGDNTI